MKHRPKPASAPWSDAYSNFAVDCPPPRLLAGIAALWLAGLCVALLAGWAAAWPLRLAAAGLALWLAAPALRAWCGHDPRGVVRLGHSAGTGWWLRERAGAEHNVQLIQPLVAAKFAICLSFGAPGRNWRVILLRVAMEPCAWRALQLVLRRSTPDARGSADEHIRD